jgi:pyrophosphate--fructose-6-phosphate 1-phosphotransferase
VDLNGRPFQKFLAHRAKWALNDHYQNPGPIQYYGANSEILNATLQLEHGHKAILRPSARL